MSKLWMLKGPALFTVSFIFTFPFTCSLFQSSSVSLPALVFWYVVGLLLSVPIYVPRSSPRP